MILSKTISEVHNEDCMIGMARYPDKYFDLAVVDPPYGVGASEMQMGKGKNKQWETGKKWDNAIPHWTYFDELARVSVNMIIWGGNHFYLPKSGGWIFWDKMRNKNISFSDGELAWTNFLPKITKAPILYDGSLGADDIRIHPTQKPVALYDWIYKNYLPNGGKVIDTHLGSGSNRIAANKVGNIDFVGFELDKDYYEAQEKRWKGFISQTRLF